MNPHDHATAPDAEPTTTLYRFCRRHRLALTDRQRSAVGIELAQLARERQIPLKKVRGREQVAPGQWSKSRLYPEAFLDEWLARYRHANAQTPPPPARSSRPKPAANG